MKPLFYVFIVLSVLVFFEVLINIRKNKLLKTYLLLIVSSLVVMNYFSYATVENRLELVVIKMMRLVYVTSTMLTVIHLVTPKIPRWIVMLIGFVYLFASTARLVKYDDIALEQPGAFTNHIFSVGAEFMVPSPVIRIIGFSVMAFAIGITFYYYRRFLIKVSKNDSLSAKLSTWMVLIVLPFFMLFIFGILGLFNLSQPEASPYLFSLFSCLTIFSILLRPRLLNNTIHPMQSNFLEIKAIPSKT